MPSAIKPIDLGVTNPRLVNVYPKKSKQDIYLSSKKKKKKKKRV